MFLSVTIVLFTYYYIQMKIKKEYLGILALIVFVTGGTFYYGYNPLTNTQDLNISFPANTGTFMTNPVSTGDNLTGDALTGEVLTGEVATGSVTTGEVLTGDVATGDVVTGDVVESIEGPQSLSLMSGYNGWNNEFFNAGDYPKLKVKAGIENLKLTVNANFSQEFVDGYKYEDSTGYGFALKVFVDHPDNGYFVDVFRKENGGLANDVTHNLEGWRNAASINEGQTWEIDLNNAELVAVPTNLVKTGHQYMHYVFVGADQWSEDKEIALGAYLSSTKEVEGWKLTNIQDMTISWNGNADDVTLVE